LVFLQNKSYMNLKNDEICENTCTIMYVQYR
jgi:hypothetical protein